jgi:hypothetical protein
MPLGAMPLGGVSDMNYAEAIASWYLRLNGFFVLENFVIHDVDRPGAPSDWDVLAVRLPYTYEVVGGQQDDWDPTLLTMLDWTRPIGLMCEVKSGALGENDPFRSWKTEYGAKRLGFTDNWESSLGEQRNRVCQRVSSG